MAWLTGWKYRKRHVINPASGAGTNYQVKIKAYYGSGTDNGENVYLNEHCRSDFGDIRFTSSDGKTELYYWMAEKVDSDYAIFWVKVSEDLSVDPVTIYIYYGNPLATTTSNIKYTSLYNHGDDFEDGIRDEELWDITRSGTGTLKEENGVLKFTSSSMSAYAGYISCNRYSFQNLEVMIKVRNAEVRSAGLYVHKNHYLDWHPEAKGDFYGIVLNNSEKTCYVKRRVSGEISTLYSGSWISNTNILKIRIENSQIRFFEGNIERYNESYALDTRNLYFVYVAWTSYDYRGTDWFDNFFIRKFVDPEPTHGTWGEEEGILTLPEILHLSVNSEITRIFKDFAGTSVAKILLGTHFVRLLRRKFTLRIKDQEKEVRVK